MENFKFESNIDLTNPKQAEALIHFIATVSGISIATQGGSFKVPQDVEIPASENKVPRQNRKKPDAKTAKAAEEEAPVDKPEEGEVSDDEVTFDMVRMELGAKVGTHRSEIKEKMKTLGATNISSVKEEDYLEFYQYLKSL